MAKRRTTKRKTAKRKAAKRSVPRAPAPRSSGDDKSGTWVALIIAVVAVVGLVLLYNDAQMSGNAVVKGIQTHSPGGVGEDSQVGWELGGQVALRYDGGEVREYCVRSCGQVCARALSSQGTQQGNCYGACQERCNSDVNWQQFGINTN